MHDRILLVEDDRSLGEAMNERLLKEGYDVQWCREVISTRRALESRSPDVIILDVRLPDGNGFELAAEIKSMGHQIPFIFLTAQAGAQERLRGFELGAQEFIPKPFHLRELLMRLKHVLSTHRSREKKNRYIFKNHIIDFRTFQIIYPDKSKKSISARDMALLHFLIIEKDRAVSRDEILDRLWGEEKFPSNRTIDNAIVRLRQAFTGLDQDTIRSIRGIGYQWSGDIE